MDPNGLLQSKNPPKKPNMNIEQAFKPFGDEIDQLYELELKTQASRKSRSRSILIEE